MGNVEIKNKFDSCCGCTACKNICPKNAIELKYNFQGFLYPIINNEKCVNCGLCIKVCDFKSRENIQHSISCYAVRHKNKEEVSTSRSGAMFIALSEYILSLNGCVYGCVLDNNLKVKHIRIDKLNQIALFKGSKYVQSDLNDVFLQCEDDLKKNKKVLFSGTGCQIAGLISFLKTKKVSQKNLVTCGIVCHGVPSPLMWEEYISFLEKKEKYKILEYNFRNKTLFGWKAHKESYTLINKKEKITQNWTNMFYSHRIFRESCFNCKYTTPYRKDDFIIGDFWGIENNSTIFNDNKGVSLVIVGSEKGMEIFEQIKKQIVFVETKIETSLQPQLIHPIEKPNRYDEFWKEYKKNHQKTIKKYFFPSQLSKLVNKIINKIKYIIKNKVEKL